MIGRLLRALRVFLGDVRRADTWRVATGIVLLGVAAAVFRSTPPHFVGAMLRLWGVCIGLVGAGVIVTGVIESRWDRLADERADQRALDRYRRRLAEED